MLQYRRACWRRYSEGVLRLEVRTVAAGGKRENNGERVLTWSAYRPEAPTPLVLDHHVLFSRQTSTQAPKLAQGSALEAMTKGKLSWRTFSSFSVWWTVLPQNDQQILCFWHRSAARFRTSARPPKHQLQPRLQAPIAAL